MNKAFVETRVFAVRRKGRLEDEDYRTLQNELAANPDKGDVMPGCGGLRKIRFGEKKRGKGKRGGVRIVYLHIPEAGRIDLITMYSKGEKEDLAEDEKKVLRFLAEQARAEAKAKLRRTRES